MGLYDYLRRLRFRFLDYFTIFICLVGMTIGLRLLVDNHYGLVTASRIFNIPVHYLIIGGFALPLFFVHLYHPRKFYLVTGIGLFMSVTFSILQLTSYCDCPVLAKDSISVCTWSVVLFLLLIVVKKIHLAQY